MRKEQFIEGSYYHIYNRGNHKMAIVRDEADQWRFMQVLRFLNDAQTSGNLLRNLARLEPGSNQLESVFELGWPANWPEKNPLVKILCYSLLPNHFHLLIKEIISGGIMKFMHKLGTSYANFFNLKYQEVGRIFQGPYKAKLVKEENYLKYLCIYIQVINVLELFPGGLEMAMRDFEKAMKFIKQYQFAGNPDYLGLRDSLIIDKDVLGEFFSTPEQYQEYIRDILFGDEKNYDFNILPKGLVID
ncbi:MAG: transposase [Candidatus Nealsonbacteria bacterium]|nr:transposase [Candidatus Nealsonbacteria bacterium]